MSDRYFPSLSGVVEVAAVPFWVNQTQESDSGMRLVVKKRSANGWRFTMDVRWLRTWLDEHTVLFAFYNDHGGSYESFLYTAKDGVTRRVRFRDDELSVKWENGGIYTGEIELETVVTTSEEPADMPTYVQSVFTTATRPAASSLWRGCEIRVKDDGVDEQVQVCLQQADGSYSWVVVAY